MLVEKCDKFVQRRKQRACVCLRGFVKTADFSHELERSSSNLFGGDGRIKIEKGFDIPAHHYALKVQNSPGPGAMLTRSKSVISPLSLADLDAELQELAVEYAAHPRAD